MKILLTEDDDSIRFLLELNIRIAIPDAEIVHASNGDTALTMCKQIRPDALVVDDRMPGLSGDALGELLRATVPTAMIISFTGLEKEAEWADVRIVKDGGDGLKGLIEAVAARALALAT